jgi:soluble lytic murein transglycosylase-like protein
MKLNYSLIQAYETYAKNETLIYNPINWELIQAIIYTESRGKSDAFGKAGEIGLMQITEIALTDVNQFLSTVEGLVIEKQSLFLSRLNIHAGTTYLWLRYKVHNDMDKAIRSYNAGDKAVINNTDSRMYLETVRNFEKQIKELS